jgi:hypothetical protein
MGRYIWTLISLGCTIASFNEPLFSPRLAQSFSNMRNLIDLIVSRVTVYRDEPIRIISDNLIAWWGPVPPVASLVSPTSAGESRRNISFW